MSTRCLRPLYYVYPYWHKVSFTIVAENHLKHLKRWMRVEVVDEKVFTYITPVSRPIVFLHPFFYNMARASKYLATHMPKFSAIVGIDVADSDEISQFAVSMTHYAKAMVVPSEYSKRAYERSGVKTPVYVVPHGLDPEWYTAPVAQKHFGELWKLKRERGMKLLLYFLWHSEWRKGWDLVQEFWLKLRRERKDVALVVKTVGLAQHIRDWVLRHGGIYLHGWLTDEQKMELYDVADMYLLFSRGGGFEINGLEAVARGEVVLASRGGSWDEYLPQWMLVDPRAHPVVLPNNPIHTGRGVEIDVDKAVNLAHVILDNIDEYRAKTREHTQTKLAGRLTWENSARQLMEIYLKICSELRT